jgi:hypothetical protein
MRNIKKLGVIGLSAAVVTLSVCAGIMGEPGKKLSDEEVDFKPLNTAKLDARSQATVTAPRPG